MPKTRRNGRGSATKGWKNQQPSYRQRSIMLKKCGKKCFLGTKSHDKKHPDFPICAKNTCKVNTKGLWAAYIRAKEWGKSRKSYKTKSKPSFKRSYYTRISRKAKKMLERRGQRVGN